MSDTKFSDLYIKYYTVKNQRVERFDSTLNDFIYSTTSYEKYKVIKEFIPNDNKMCYKWGNFAYAMMFDYNCKRNDKINKLTRLCLLVESKIRRGDIDIVFYDFVNDVLPLLNSLTLDEVKMINNACRESEGPLYKTLIKMRQPEMIIELFDYHNV